MCRQIEQTAAAGDLAAYLAADRDFHLGMLALASNTRLVEIVSSLVAQKALGGSAREHRTLLGLVAKG